MVDLADMPLHDITEQRGEAGLRERFALEIAVMPDAGRLRAALAWASDLHRDDRRVREPYVNHLLRVAIRIAHHYRVTDADVLCAALLHDAVEDHATEIVAVADGAPDGPAEAALAARALIAVATRCGDRVAGPVAAVTNPPHEPGIDRHEQYRDHVRASLAAHPWARVIKLSDFTDNAVGITWTPAAKAAQVAPKYAPLIDDLRVLLWQPDTPLADDVKSDIDEQLSLAATRLSAVLDGPPPRTP